VGPVGVQGFPLCPVCGETRSPNSTQVELDHFREAHRERCHVPDISFFALHVDIVSDVLCLGPYNSVDEAVNLYEGLLTGARHLLDMGGNELEGFFYADEHASVWAVLYDPLPGGTGFLAQLLAYWDRVCEEGIHALNRCDCQNACYKCLQHFRNQQYHDILNRFSAMQLLGQLRGDVHKEHRLPPRFDETVSQEVLKRVESPAEEKFLTVLQQHAFTPPEHSQYRVDLGNGNYTIADFSWAEKQVLIFIDGTSLKLHGDPDRARQDRNKRRQAELLGWHVVVITAQELSDEESMALKLEDIEFYLGQ
jgi:hypothetical protein